jgi:inosine-uridine nucleoside N-ribohydrolase
MTRRQERVRVVFDTDAGNEIDDQFALAWALRRSDALQVEGVHAAPYSHGRYLCALAEASEERGGATSRFDEIALSMGAGRREALLADTPPHEGMERSHEEIMRVFEASEVDPDHRVLRGARDFLPAAETPVESEAALHLIELARSARPDAPIHVAAIGAPTNVASALLMDPAIAPNLRVLFVAGYPSGAGLDDDSFNLVQDRFASNVLFESGAPLVYLPGYQVAEPLSLSLPEAQAWLTGRGRLAEFLYERFRNNPISPDAERPGQSWVLWDVLATAYLIEPDWVSTRPVPRARLGVGHAWEPLPDDRGTMAEGYRAHRNEILGDLFERMGTG